MKTKGNYRVRALAVSVAAAWLTVWTCGPASAKGPQTDLSGKGTANCYVVSDPGSYTFRATCGNSNEPPAGIVDVDWLWATSEGLVSMVRYDRGYATFDASAGRGNVILAAFDDKGEIVWSWHIWLTDDPAANLHSVAGERYRIMDRNLGATAAVSDDVNAYGLYYQWGRKDPFPGANTIGQRVKKEEEEAFTTATAEYVSNPVYNLTFSQARASVPPAGGEIAYVIAHPMTYIYYHPASGGTAGGWFNSDVAGFLDLWGYDAASGDNRKSVYDPCPPGYKVAPSPDAVWKGMTASNAPIVSVDTNGRMYSSGEMKGYYPAAGFRGGYLSWLDVCGNYWTARPFDPGAGKGAAAQTMRFDTESGVRTGVGINMYCGNSVRCVTE